MYSEKVMDHFNHPRNVGEIENPSGDLELRLPGKHGAERALSGPVRAHYGVNLTLAYQQVYTLEYLLFADSRMQVFYLQ